MNTNNIFKDCFEVHIDQAVRGDISSSKYLLGKASKLLRAEEALPSNLSDWLATALETMANSKGDKINANEAFKVKRGRKSTHTSDEEELIAQSIHASNLGLHKGESTINGKEGAYTEAAREHNVTPNTAEKIYKKYKEGFEIDEELRRQHE